MTFPVKKHTYALIDPVAINLNLINSLKEKGINHIYLFSNVTANDVLNTQKSPKQPSLFDKSNLLRQYGFKVCGVITQGDPFEKRGLGYVYSNYFIPLHKKINLAYQELNTFVKESAKYNGYQNPKGTMYCYFLNNLPRDCADVIVFDNHEKNLQSVKLAAEEWQRSYQFDSFTSTIQCPSGKPKTKEEFIQDINQHYLTKSVSYFTAIKSAIETYHKFDATEKTAKDIGHLRALKLHQLCHVYLQKNNKTIEQYNYIQKRIDDIISRKDYKIGSTFFNSVRDYFFKTSEKSLSTILADTVANFNNPYLPSKDVTSPLKIVEVDFLPKGLT